MNKVEINQKYLPFEIRLLDVSDINPRVGFESGQIYKVVNETRKGYNIMSDKFGVLVEIYYKECEKIVPEIETDKKGDRNVK